MVEPLNGGEEVDNLSKYGHITLKSVDIFTELLQHFPKNRAILVKKFGEENKWSKSVSGYLKTKNKE